MAETFAGLALAGVNPVIQNYDTIYDTTKRKVKETVPILGKNNPRDGDDDDQGHQSMDDYRYSSQRSGNQDRQRGRDQPAPRSSQAYYYQESYRSHRNGPKVGDRDPPGNRRDYTPRSTLF